MDFRNNFSSEVLVPSLPFRLSVNKIKNYMGVQVQGLNVRAPLQKKTAKPPSPSYSTSTPQLMAMFMCCEKHVQEVEFPQGWKHVHAVVQNRPIGYVIRSERVYTAIAVLLVKVCIASPLTTCKFISLFNIVVITLITRFLFQHILFMVQ